MNTSEFEVVKYPKLPHINMFLNSIMYRNLHLHNEIELLYVLKGSANIRTDNDNFAVEKDSIALFNSNEPHEIDALSCNSNIIAIIIQISKNFLRDYYPDIKTILFNNSNISTILSEEVNLTLGNLLKETAQAFILTEKLYQLKCVENISKILNILLNKVPYTQFSEKEYLAKKKADQRMSRIFSYIDNNYQLSIRLQDLAYKEGISSTHLSHIFSDNLGLTFQDYLNNKRFEHSVRLINNNSKTLYEIAIESGFSDPKYMAKMFLKRFNLTPKEFKRKVLDNQYLKVDETSSILEFHYNDTDSLKILNERS